MKTKYFILLILLIIITCTSCRGIIDAGCRTVEKTSDSLVAIRDEKNTIDTSKYYVAPDSSIFQALFDCDSLNNVRIREINDLKSKGINTEFVFRDNTLYYRTDRDKMEHLIYSLKSELYMLKISKKTEYKFIKQPPVIVIQNSRFAKFAIRGFLLCIIIIAGFSIYKFRIYRLIRLIPR